jgi:hypothetical protein
LAHKTKIGGTAYEISGGRTLVGGTAYSIDKGRTLVDGAGYDISFGLTVGSLPVGSVVKLGTTSNGTAVTREFIVVNQGIPQESDYYDETADGTWLLSKNPTRNITWGSSSGGWYQGSNVKAYLEDDYYNGFNSGITSIIKEVRIPYVLKSGAGSLRYGENGLATKVFALSAYEVGLTSVYGDAFKSEGARLDYFKSGDKDTNRIAYYNGSAVTWWLRSPIPSSSSTKNPSIINRDGMCLSQASGNSSYARPALVLPKETPIDENFNVIA